MNVVQIPRECWKSVRIVYTDEWWLFPAGLVVAIAYPLWVGATGAAITTFADFAGLSLALDPWTDQMTWLAVVIGTVWVVAPAAVGTQLVLDRLTNAHGNLRACYRLRHPLSLFVVPVALLGFGLALLATAGSGSVPGQALVVIGAVSLALRGTAYAYRVFALSLPLLAQAILFLSIAGLAVVLLAAGAIGAGRADIVAATAAGIAGVVGVPAIAAYLDGTVAVGPVQVSMLAATVVVPAVLPTAVYVALQVSVSTIQRLRKPDVKRSSLRTGQRYPGFARPTAGPSRGGSAGSKGSASGTGAGATASGTGGTGGTGAADGGGSTTGDNTPGTAASDAGAGGPAAAGTTAQAAIPSGSSAGSAGAADGTVSAGSSDGGDDHGGGDSGQAATADAAGDPAADAESPDDAAAADGSDGDGVGTVRNTRVYSPPEDAEDITLADAEEAARRTASGKFCPNCEESYDGATRTFCPTCGSRLEQS